MTARVNLGPIYMSLNQLVSACCDSVADQVIEDGEFSEAMAHRLRIAANTCADRARKGKARRISSGEKS